MGPVGGAAPVSKGSRMRTPRTAASARARTAARALALVTVCLAALLLAAAPALAEDVTAPAVTAFQITPSHVDTSEAAQIVTITLTIEETQSSLVELQVELISALGQQCVYSARRLDSSDDTHWTYTATATLPEGSATGVWNAWVFVRDGVGNVAWVPYWELDAKFGPGAAEITNDAATCDTERPQITALQLTPSHVDTTTSTQEVEITVTLTDDQTGVYWAIAWLSPPQSTQWTNVTLERVSGDEHSGVYKGTAVMQRWSRSGPWRLSVDARDMIGNGGGHYDLFERFGTSAQVTNDATVEDVTLPTFTDLTITPNEFDTESGATELAVSATATDDLSGVAHITVQVSAMLSYQTHWIDLERVAGTSLDGTWAGSITLPQGAEVGLWTTQAGIGDAIRNSRSYDTDSLSLVLPGASCLVLANTAEAEQVTVRRQWTLYGERSTVTFPEGTVVTRVGGGPLAFYKMVAMPFEFDGVPVADLEGPPVATLRFGIPGLDLSFSEPVTVRMQVGQEYDGYLVQIQSLTETGEAWTDETTAKVSGGQVTFAVDHATRFAASAAGGRVTRVSPRKGPRTTRPIVRGDGFGRRRGRSVVLFGGRAVKDYGVWTPTYFRFGIPRWATPGRYKIALRVNGVTTSLGRFTVTRR